MMQSRKQCVNARYPSPTVHNSSHRYINADLKETAEQRRSAPRQERKQPPGGLADGERRRGADGAREVRRGRAAPQLDVAEVGVRVHGRRPGRVVAAEERAACAAPLSAALAGPRVRRGGRHSREVEPADVDGAAVAQQEALLVDGLDVVVAVGSVGLWGAGRAGVRTH